MGLSIFMVGRMETGPAGDWDDPSGIFHLLEDLAEEGDDMKTELTRYFRNSLYWLVLGAGFPSGLSSPISIPDSAAMRSGRYPQNSGIR